MIKTFGLTCAVLLGLSLSGCLAHPASHETFVNQGTYWVGKTIYALRNNSWPSQAIKQLPNGNMEEEWISGYVTNRCREFYEYDPRTSIIVGWRFEGSKADCISVAP